MFDQQQGKARTSSKSGEGIDKYKKSTQRTANESTQNGNDCSGTRGNCDAFCISLVLR